MLKKKKSLNNAASSGECGKNIPNKTEDNPELKPNMTINESNLNIN